MVEAEGVERDWTPRLTIGAIVLLIVGVSVGLGLFLPEFRQMDWGEADNAVGAAGMVLAGPTALGVPWLIWRKYRGRTRGDRRWGPGRLLWFAHGSAAWLLCPPIVAKRAGFTQSGVADAANGAQICYFYGTPLMAVYMLLALRFGGRLGGSRRGRRRIDWIERFGLALAILWAMVGAAIIWMIYTNRFR